MIALNALPFWIACAAAVLLVVPVRSSAIRHAVMAVVNLAFLALLLQWRAIGLAGGIVAAYILVQFVARPRLRVLFAVLAAGWLLGLFAVHKSDALSARITGDGIGQILAVVGYSYVALRMVEVLRAVFDGRHPAPGVVAFVNYLLPFHMLAAGPIQAYDDYVRAADASFEPTAGDVLRGIERIAGGLFKKFVLAYFVQKLFLTNLDAGGVYFLLEMQLTLIWLFLDFSAYSDIAVGVGTLIGVATPENFNRPLAARNVIDFWERWHISLSLFIRRNIFIPIQISLVRRNGSPLLSASVAIAVSFVLCGIWHGLGIGFLVWGAVQSVGLIVTRVYAQTLQRRLGTVGVRGYLANPWLHAVGVVLTFELQAIAVAAVI